MPVRSEANAEKVILSGPNRVDVLGVGVSAVNMDLSLQFIDSLVASREPNYICITGVHGIIECQNDDALRKIHNQAGLVTPDGMPLVFWARLMGNRVVSRVYGPDLLLAACDHFQSRGYRHFFYGGGSEVPARLTDRLCERFPDLQIAGTHSPPYRELSPDEEEDIIDQIQRASPDIVWVGLSTPKQERWMSRFVNRLNGPVLIGVGAAFDFHAGLKKQAPRWMQRSSLEWLFRVLSEPRRLWRRYLKIVPLFLLLTLLHLAGFRRRSLSK